MSEEENPVVAEGEVEAEAPAEVDDADVKEEAPAAEESAPLDPQSALKIVLRTSLFSDGLARGLHESVKALDRREAHLCVLSSSCNEPAYTKLITALCKEHNIPLIKVEDGKTLGEWAGLCKYNPEGKAVKVVGCSCAVIRSWGEDTEARQYITNHIKSSS
jgi:small subunit ribosomal protein S12e